MISTLTELREIVDLVDETEVDYDEGLTEITRDEWYWMNLTRRLASDILGFYTEREGQ